MADLTLSKATANRYPHPLGRRIKINAVLSGLGGDALVEDFNAGLLSTTVTTGGIWANLDAKSVTTMGYLANLPLTSVIENAVLLTSHAPLTKGWGDATLADESDVTVLIDGVAATVIAMDAVLGVLVLDQKVVDDAVVDVSYYYTPNPTLELNSLNDSAFLLNQHQDRHAVPFTYNTVLGPYSRPQPKQYEHRYTAFDYPYTSVLNDPTSMLLNEPKNRNTLPNFQRTNDTSAIFFEGDSNPDGFDFIGATTPSVTLEDGLFVVEDASASDDVVSGDTAFWRRDIDLTFEHLSIVNFRVRVDTWTSNGDFSGIAAGYTDETYLYMVGFLEMGDFRTVSLLKNPEDESMWESYSQVTGEAVERNGAIDQLDFSGDPPISVGQRIFVDGTTYTVLDIDQNTLDPTLYHVFLDEELPAEGTTSLFVEVDWTVERTYRLFKEEDDTVNLLVGGNVVPIASEVSSDLAIPTEVFEVFENNTLFFGAVDRKAVSRSLWDFVRYSIVPKSDLEQASNIVVSSAFNELPEDDPNNPWYLANNQGYATVFNNDFLLTQSAGQPQVGGAVNYARVEPFLTSKAIVNAQTRFRVQSYSTGIPALFTVADDKKEVTLAVFDEDAEETFINTQGTSQVTRGFWSQADAESLQSRGLLSGYNTTDPDSFLSAFGGAQTFAHAGWTDNLDADEVAFFDHYLQLTHSGAASAASLTKSTIPFENVITGARVRVQDYTALVDGNLPFYFGVSDGTDQVFLTLLEDTTNKVVFTDIDGDIVTSGGDPLGFDFEWDDSAFHHYRIARYGENVSVFVDGVYQAVFDVVDLPNATTTTATVKFGLLNGQVNLDLDYLFAHSALHPSRRVGLYTGGGDLLDASNYEVVAQEWLGTFLDVEIRRDPTGITKVYLNGQTTPSFEKTYQNLPDRNDSRFNINTTLGYVQFGTLDPQAYSEVLWDNVRYEIINQREVQESNNTSILNRVNTITSPEPVIDQDPETVTVISATANLIYLSQTEMLGRKVLSVTSTDGTTAYPFTFDFNSNSIAVTGAGLPSANEEVRVVFFHREPYTEAYLENNFAFTRLNQSTPVVPLRQQVEITRAESFSSSTNNIEDVLNTDADFILNDGKTLITFTRNDQAYYECLNLLTTTDDGLDDLLSPACDEDGLTEIIFGGPFSEEVYELPEQGDEKTRHNYRLGYFNNTATPLNDIETNTVGIQSPVDISIVRTEVDAVDPASDETVTGGSVLVDYYGSGQFNSRLSTLARTASVATTTYDTSVIAKANTLVYSPYPLTFTESITTGVAPIFSGHKSWDWSSRTIQLVTNSTGVGRLGDRHSGENAYQVTPAEQPLKVLDTNGLPYLRYDGINDSLVASISGDFSNGLTLFVVSQMDTYSVLSGEFRLLDGSSQASYELYANSVTTSTTRVSEVNRSTTDANFTSGRVYELGQLNMITAVHEDPVVVGRGLYEERTLVRDVISGGGNLTMDNTPVTAVIGNGRAGTVLDGRIYEVVLYEGALTDPQIAEVWDWLESEWGGPF